MSDQTNEFSFVLKCSPHGVGVFATHNIQSGTYLRLFGDENSLKRRSTIRDKKDIPEFLQSYCIDRGSTMICPKDFGHLEPGWYLNHSTTPNAIHRQYDWFASRDIATGEEITIDYNSLEEPDETKEEYYRH